MSAGLIGWLGFVTWLISRPIALTWAQSRDEARENHILTLEDIAKLDAPRKRVAREYLQHANQPLSQGKLKELYQKHLDSAVRKEQIENQRKSLSS